MLENMVELVGLEPTAIGVPTYFTSVSFSGTTLHSNSGCRIIRLTSRRSKGPLRPLPELKPTAQRALTNAPTSRLT